MNSLHNEAWDANFRPHQFFLPDAKMENPGERKLSALPNN